MDLNTSARSPLSLSKSFYDDITKDIPSPVSKDFYDAVSKPAEVKQPSAISSRYEMASPGEIAETVGAVGEAVVRTPLQVAGAAASAIRGGSREGVADKDSFLTRIINRANQDSEDFQKKYADKKVVIAPLTKLGFPADIDTQTITRFPQQAGFSGAAAVAGLASGLGAAAVSGPAAPIVGRAVGMAASGAAGYRMQKDMSAQQLYTKLNETSMKTVGRELSPEEWKTAYDKNEGSLVEQGISEAIPEAIGNLVGFELFFGAAKNVFGKQLAKTTIGKTLDKYGAGAVGKMLAEQATEQTTETWTQQWQHNIDVEMGLNPGETRRSWASFDDLRQSNKEVFADILLLSTIMGGAGLAGEHVKDKMDTKKSAQVLKDVVAENKFNTIPNEFLPAMYEHAQELSDKRPKDKDLTAARDAFATEMDKRGIDFDMTSKFKEYLKLDAAVKTEGATGEDVARWASLRDEFKEKNISPDLYQEYLTYQSDINKAVGIQKLIAMGKATEPQRKEFNRLTDVIVSKASTFGFDPENIESTGGVANGDVVRKPLEPAKSAARDILLGDEPAAKRKNLTAKDILTEGDVNIQSEEDLTPEILAGIDKKLEIAGTGGARTPLNVAGETPGKILDITEEVKAQDKKKFDLWDTQETGTPSFVRAKVERLFAEGGEAAVLGEYGNNDNVSAYARYRLGMMDKTAVESKETPVEVQPGETVGQGSADEGEIDNLIGKISRGEISEDFEFPESYTPMNISNLWDDLYSVKDDIDTKNKPKMDALIAERNKLKSAKDAVSRARKKQIDEEMDILGSESGLAMHHAETAFASAQEKLGLKAVELLKKEGIDVSEKDQDDIYELVSVLSDGQQNERGWEQPILRQVADEFKAAKKSAAEETPKVSAPEGLITQSYTERMKNAATADEGRSLISQYQEEFASIEREAGLAHSIGKGGSGLGSRGYGTLTPKQKTEIVKNVTAKNPAMGKRLEDLVSDIDESEPHWKSLLTREQAKNHPDSPEIKAAGTGGARTPMTVAGETPPVVVEPAKEKKSAKQELDDEVKQYREAGHVINDHGVYVEPEKITIPFGKSSGREGMIDIAKGPDGKFRIGVHISKKYGDFEGSGHAPSIHEETYNTREEALKAGIDKIRERIKGDDPKVKAALKELAAFETASVSTPVKIVESETTSIVSPVEQEGQRKVDEEPPSIAKAKAGDLVVYRGDNAPDVGSGQWFSTDIDDAAQYGKVKKQKIKVINPRYVGEGEVPFGNLGEWVAEHGYEAERQGYDSITDGTYWYLLAPDPTLSETPEKQEEQGEAEAPEIKAAGTGGARGHADAVDPTHGKIVTVNRKEHVDRSKAGAADLAADYKARGLDRHLAWDEFIKDRILKPEIDAKIFYALFDKASPLPLVGKSTSEEVSFVPSHSRISSGELVQADTPNENGITQVITESGRAETDHISNLAPLGEKAPEEIKAAGTGGARSPKPKKETAKAPEPKKEEKQAPSSAEIKSKEEAGKAKVVKTYLLEHIDEAISARTAYETNKTEDAGPMHVIIDVPMDGKFVIVNDLEHLNKFRTNVNKLKVTAALNRLPQHSDRPTGKSTDLITQEAEAEVADYWKKRGEFKEQHGAIPAYIVAAKERLAKYEEIKRKVDAKEMSLKQLGEEAKAASKADNAGPDAWRDEWFGRTPTYRDLTDRIKGIEKEIRELEEQRPALEKTIREYYPGLAKEMFEGKAAEEVNVPEEKKEVAPAKDSRRMSEAIRERTIEKVKPFLENNDEKSILISLERFANEANGEITSERLDTGGSHEKGGLSKEDRLYLNLWDAKKFAASVLEYMKEKGLIPKAEEKAATLPDLAITGQANSLPGHPDATYAVHTLKPDRINLYKVQVVIQRHSPFLSVDGKGMYAEEAYRKALTEYERKLSSKTPDDIKADGTGGARGPKAEKVQYLDELINYGGEPRSRGSVIVEMQKQGMPQKQIDAYMMGAKTLTDEGLSPDRQKEQDEINGRLKAQNEREAEFEYRKKHDALLEASDKGPAAEGFSLDDAKRFLSDLDAAPGDDPKARQAILDKYPELSTSESNPEAERKARLFSLSLDQVEGSYKQGYIAMPDVEEYLAHWNASPGRSTEAYWEDGAIRQRTPKKIETETAGTGGKRGPSDASTPRDDAYTAAVGKIAGKADRAKDKGYEFAYGETEKGSELYWDMVGIFSGTSADRLVEAGITIRKSRIDVPTADIAKEVAEISDADLDALLDMPETKGTAPKTTNEAVKNIFSAARDKQRGSIPAAQPKALDDILSAVAKEGVSGAGEALKGLYELFGGSSLKSFPGGIDEDTYAKAKPHFEAAFEHFIKVGKGLREFTSTMIAQFGDAIRPYLKRFLTEKRDGEKKEEVASDEEGGVINLDENTGKGEGGARTRRKLTDQEKAEKEQKAAAAAERKEKKAGMGEFQNVGYVYDPEKLNQKTKDKPPKSAAKIILDEMVPGKIWGVDYPEEATPGVPRTKEIVQKYFLTFKEHLLSHRERLRYMSGKSIDDKIEYWLNFRNGSIDMLKEWASE